MICQEKEQDHLDSIQQVLSDESFILVHKLPIMEVGGHGRPCYEIRVPIGEQIVLEHFS